MIKTEVGDSASESKGNATFHWLI